MKPAVAVVALVLGLAVGGSTAAASPVALLVSQGTAFSYLGHSCGGIQEHSYATGFDVATGYPVGDVYIQTRCGGSGRGGGYTSTTYSAWLVVKWSFGAAVLSSARLAGGPVPNTTFTATDANGDTIYNTATVAYLNVPAPGAPTGVTATQTGSSVQVTWKPATPNANVLTSSTIVATPVGSAAPVVTATVAGPAASGIVGPLQPATTYGITVANATAGGAGPASAPAMLTTVAASIAPAAPTGVTAKWASSTLLSASWKPATGGNAPVDEYQVQITGSDAGGTFAQTLPGTASSTTFSVSSVPDWTVKVRAHDAAGWSPWSAGFTLGGL